ncbi:MAG: hypothetical protein PHY93_17710 [Bacteriovorax sp.]|nr:hypothetical protein [Bacteriovorax sp.]
MKLVGQYEIGRRHRHLSLMSMVLVQLFQEHSLILNSEVGTHIIRNESAGSFNKNPERYSICSKNSHRWILELNVDPIHWAVVNAIKDLYNKYIVPIWENDKKQDRKIASLEAENIQLKEALCEINSKAKICQGFNALGKRK